MTAPPGECTRVPGLGPTTSIYSILTTAMHPHPSLPRLRGREGWGPGLPVARRQTRRCLRVLRGRYQGRGTAPAVLERRESRERAHPYGHVHRLHRAAPRHGRRSAGHSSSGDRVGGIHHAKQRGVDHVRQTPGLREPPEPLTFHLRGTYAICTSSGGSLVCRRRRRWMHRQCVRRRHCRRVYYQERRRELAILSLRKLPTIIYGNCHRFFSNNWYARDSHHL